MSYEIIAGEHGQPEAQTKLLYKQGNRDFEMIETIIVRDLPKEFSWTYTFDGAINHIMNSFVVDVNTTKVVSETRVEMQKITYKIMAFIMPGMFRKAILKVLTEFKEFAEKEGLGEG